MTQKLTTAPTKTTAKRKSVGILTQTIVDAKTKKAPIPKTPTTEEVSDLEWMNWVEYAQSRLRYLENRLIDAENKLEELKASNLGLQKRLLQGQ
jgi:hypothetical protein